MSSCFALHCLGYVNHWPDYRRYSGVLSGKYTRQLDDSHYKTEAAGKLVATMPSVGDRLLRAEAVAVGGDKASLLYVSGGFDGSTALRAVERYDKSTQRWTEVAPMTSARQVSCGELPSVVFCVCEMNGFVWFDAFVKQTRRVTL